MTVPSSKHVNFKVSWRIETNGNFNPLEHRQLAWLPHLSLKEIAENQLKIARDESSPQKQIMMGLVSISLSAFYVEAALNFLVKEHLPDSETIIRKNRWNEKAKMLIEPFCGTLHPGKQPWQDVAKAFEIRNSLAHPKFAVAFSAPNSQPQVPLFQGITPDAAGGYFESCVEFVCQLHDDMFGSREFTKLPSNVLDSLLNGGMTQPSDKNQAVPYWYQIRFEFDGPPIYVFEHDIPENERHLWNFEKGRAFTWAPGKVSLTVTGGEIKK